MAKASAKKQVAKPKSEVEAKPAENGRRSKTDLGKELLSWSLVPMLYQTKKAIIFIVSTLAFAGLVWYATQAVIYSLLTIAISLGASASFLLPTTYRLCEFGVEARTAATSTVRKWQVFRGHYMVEDGVLLAYYKRNMRERVARGLFLYFGDVDRERVKSILTDRIEQP